MIPKVISEETKYKGEWLEVVGTRVDLGNGKSTSWDVVKSKDAVATVVLDDENNVLLGREYKVAHKGFIYTLAAGVAEKQDSEEALREEARKELREEFGINARQIEKLATVVHSGRATPKWHIYMAKDIYTDPLKNDEVEEIEVIKLPINEAMKLLLTNKSHFVALLGILLVKDKLKL